MLTKRYDSVRSRALGFTSALPLTLFFCPPLCASERPIDVSLASYAANMGLALLFLLLLGFLALKFLPGRFRVSAGGRLRLEGTLMLGRDIIYVVRAGPDVVAVLVSRTGATVLGRWSREEWESDDAQSEAAPDISRGNPR